MITKMVSKNIFEISNYNTNFMYILILGGYHKMRESI